MRATPVRVASWCLLRVLPSCFQCLAEIVRQGSNRVVESDVHHSIARSERVLRPQEAESDVRLSRRYAHIYSTLFHHSRAVFQLCSILFQSPNLLAGFLVLVQ